MAFIIDTNLLTMGFLGRQMLQSGTILPDLATTLT